MAKNRALQQKVRKIKSRGKLKPYNTVVVNGTGPKYSVNMTLMSHFHGNPKTIGMDDGYMDRMFPSANMTPHRRLEVLHRISQMREMLPLERSVFYVAGKFSSLRLFVKTPDGAPAYYFYVEHHFKLKVVRKSITYRTKEAAMAAQSVNKIRWKEILNLSEVVAPSTS